jgi:hypothetical protein
METFLQRLASGAAGFVVAFNLLACNDASGPSAKPNLALESRTRARPIDDFVSMQGTFCFPDGVGGCLVFVPPVANFVGWSTVIENRVASVDYAGLADVAIQTLSGGTKSFGTATEGSITERPLADGRAEVFVRLHTTNALIWAIPGDGAGNFDFGNAPLLFGYRVPDVLAGATPALGEASLDIKFINPAPGRPLPDLLQLLAFPEAGQEVIQIGFTAHGNGALRPPFGVAEGTPGRLSITERLLLNTAFKGATADGFPVERVELRVVGR